MTKVNWRDMETEELGSVYESLLELTPRVNLEGREFSFAEGDETRGNARKTTGSYYTPDSLVKLLLDTTLDPVLDAAEARNPTDPVSEILKLSIIDPACGSGHFLLGAARRTAARVARHRMPGAISKEVFQHALREVVSNCIYGTDRNPMAVELCKVALWIEALEPGKPLSFLDSRIQCGDSLIGVFDYEMLKAGIPNEAYKALSGDDSDVARAYAQLNREERDGNAATGFIKSLAAPTEIVDGARQLAAMPEDTLAEVKSKARAFARYEASDQWQRLKIACDMYVAAFFFTKAGEQPTARTLAQMPVPTTGALWEALGGNIRSEILAKHTTVTAEANSALHWPLAFPAVMARGGFDAVVGNPPWERIKLQEQEFFASRDLEIAAAKNKAARDRMIKALSQCEIGTPQRNLYLEFLAAKRSAEASSEFVRKTGRFPLSGVGDVNTYALFAEHFSKLARVSVQNSSNDISPSSKSDLGLVVSSELASGRAGLIVPTGIATDSSTSAFFGALVSSKRIKALIDFENREKLFPAVDSRMKFSILAIGPAEEATFAFFLQNPAMYEEKERRFSLSPEQIAAINPNTKTAPVFRSRADAELTAKLYSKAPILIEERPDHQEGDLNPWGISFQRMFDMSNDSDLFASSGKLERDNFVQNGSTWEHSDGRHYVPLYEAKMIHHFDHRWATYEGLDEEQAVRDATLEEKRNPNFDPTPRYWVPEEEVGLRASRVPSRLKSAFRKDDSDGCLKTLVEWVLGSTPGINFLNPVASLRDIQAHLNFVLGTRATSSDVVGRSLQNWLKSAAIRGLEMQRFTPLFCDDLEFLKDYQGRWLELTGALIDRKNPRWLLGVRGIARATDERTIIGSIIPRVAVGNSMQVWCVPGHIDAKYYAVLMACLSSMPFDYVARQKIGGINLNFFYVEQFPTLAPEQYTEEELRVISKIMLELTYTSSAMQLWAEDLGYFGKPFGFDEIRRSKLKAYLDAFFAKKYSLTRTELEYILDPNAVNGKNYPTETFRGLMQKEISQYGEYRSKRLILEAYDQLNAS